MIEIALASAGFFVTAERLRQLFCYDPQTGVFTRLVTRKRPAKVGTISRAGYHMIVIDGRLYRAHRLVWLYVHGRWPDGTVDHVNGDTKDNRLENLRDVTFSENNKNKRKPTTNKSGVVRHAEIEHRFHPNHGRGA